MSVIAGPKLAPPGAGLPKVEWWIARALFGLRWRMGNRAAFEARFARERGLIGRLTAGLDQEDASERVLIRRLRGLEDSSRHWSVWMTLDHLRIVNLGIALTIARLARGETPPGRASTAAVKPSAGIGEEVIGEYEEACDHLARTVAGVPNLKTPVRYAHPWFGALDAFQWHALAATHMGIHRRQIERIRRALGLSEGAEGIIHDGPRAASGTVS